MAREVGETLARRGQQGAVFWQRERSAAGESDESIKEGRVGGCAPGVL